MAVNEANDGQLLADDEPPAVEVVNPHATAALVLVCDHASNRVPRRLGTLGLTAEQLADHIAWDPGAAAVARGLASALNAPLVLSGYSRLVIDCNRPLDNPLAMAARSADVIVPGNADLTQAERAQRIDELYRPYHAAIAELLNARTGRPTALLSIHSFTPVLHDQARPWQVGVSHWRDGRLATLLRNALAAGAACNVGDNQPYPIEPHIDYTIPTHGEGRGLPSAMIELRQDELRDEAGVVRWIGRLAVAWWQVEREALRLV